MEKLLTLLTLERQAQEATSLLAYAHVVVNETQKLVPYKQAIFWHKLYGRIQLEKISGNAVLDTKSSYAQTIETKLKRFLKEPSASSVTVHADNENPVIVVRLQTRQEGLLGGLWIECDTIPDAAKTQILQELSGPYSVALALQAMRGHHWIWRRLRNITKHRKWIIVATIVLILFPVRMTITAPAEIIAEDAYRVTIPFDGVIEKVVVEPGDKVTKGQILARMENTNFSADANLAKQALETSKSSLARLRREALMSPDKKNQLGTIESEMAEKKIQYDYARTIEEKGDIMAPAEGVVIFADAHRLQGKPVQTGEPIMMVADTSQYRLRISVPVDAMVPINLDSGVSFYLNVSPLSRQDAKIGSIGYEATQDPNGTMSYKVIADIPEGSDLRIGWQGTAKIDGNWTFLSYAFLRRPVLAIRQLTGL